MPKWSQTPGPGTSESSRRRSRATRKHAIEPPASGLASRRRAADILSQYEQMDCLFAAYFPEMAREISQQSQRRANSQCIDEGNQGAFHLGNIPASSTTADGSNCLGLFTNTDANSSPGAMVYNANSSYNFIIPVSEHPAMELTATAADDGAVAQGWTPSNALYIPPSLFNDPCPSDSTIADPSGLNTPSEASNFRFKLTETQNERPGLMEPLNKARQGLADLESLLQSWTTHQLSIL